MALKILYNTVNLDPDNYTGSVTCRYDNFLNDVPKKGDIFAGDNVLTLPSFNGDEWRVENRIFTYTQHSIVVLNLTNRPDIVPTQTVIDIVPNSYFKRAELKDALKGVDGNTANKDASFNTFSGILLNWETGTQDWTDDTQIKVPGTSVKIKAIEWQASFYDTTIHEWNNLASERVFDWNRVPSPIKLDAPYKLGGVKNFLLKQNLVVLKQSPKYLTFKYFYSFTFWVLPSSIIPNTSEWL